MYLPAAFFILSKMKFFFQSILKDLRKIYISFQGGRIEPCRKCYRTIHRTIHLSHSYRRHIDIHKYDALIFLCINI